MKRRLTVGALAGLSMLLLPLQGLAEETTGDGFRQHGQHEHGAAVMNIAREGNRLYIEWLSPAMNLLGFEHAPQNEAEFRLLHQVEEQLEQPDRLFHFASGADCALVESDVDLPYSELAVMPPQSQEARHHDSPHNAEHDNHHEEHSDHHEEHSGHHDEHSDSHGHDDERTPDHHEHDEHDLAEHDQHRDSHTDIRATYTYECSGAALTYVELRVFEYYAGLQRLRVQLVTESGQQLLDLTPEQPRITLLP